MRIRVGLSAIVFAASFFVASGAWAQTAPSQQSSPSGTTPSASDPQDAVNSTAPAAAPAKKVWTNEDVGGLRGTSPISTVGVSRAKQQKQATTKATASPDTIRSYQDRISGLQRQLPGIDSQISDLQAALNGQSVNSARHVGGAKIDDWHDELTRLQKKKSDLETRISSLQDEARHKGVPENEIPE